MNNKYGLILYTMLIVVIFASAILMIRRTNISSTSDATLHNLGTDSFLNILTCFRQTAEDQGNCMDKFVAAYAEANHEDTKALLVDEELARTQSTEFENNCHPIVHAIGRYTYQVLGNVGDAFNACDQSCHSGCYHGVMERLFYSDEDAAAGLKHVTYADLQKKIPGICDPDKFANPLPQLIFQCLHGVGHAVLYSLQYDLRLALKTCDLFQTEYQQTSCYGGVVMENITAFDKTKRDLKPDDPLYPCDSLDAKYQEQCYLMQTSIMSEYGMDIDQIAQTCRKAGGPNVNFCFISLGRDLSNYVRTGDVQRAVDACEVTSGLQQEPCFQGVLYALIDNTWNAKYAYLFCDSLVEPANQAVCYSISNNYFNWAYDYPKQRVYQECDQFSQKVDLCKQHTY